MRINSCFGEVIRECAQREDTWINDEIIESYSRLHELGWAHSVETMAGWRACRRSLSASAIGGAFSANRCFTAPPMRQDCALGELVERLRKRRFTLLDIQWLTPHLAQFGATEIPRALYLHLLNAAVDLPRRCCRIIEMVGRDGACLSEAERVEPINSSDSPECATFSLARCRRNPA